MLFSWGKNVAFADESVLHNKTGLSLIAQSPTEDPKNFLQSLGAIGVLALLVYRLPQIFEIINKGKTEVALIMKDIQSEAYTNYASNLQLIMKNSDTRIEKLEDAIDKMGTNMSEQTTTLKLMNQKLEKSNEH